MIITIDGPSGAGKSTVARRLAQRLGFQYLDTGAMYRAVALAGLRAGVDWQQPEQLAELARTVRLELRGERIWLDGEEVGEEIRTPAVTAITRHAADNRAVREHLVDLQREMARNGNVVTEGRDQGTIAFPDADRKFFVTATPEERARRRLAELLGRNERATFDEILRAQTERDARDAARDVGPLAKAADAVEVITDGMTIDEVVERLVELIRR